MFYAVCTFSSEDFLLILSLPPVGSAQVPSLAKSILNGQSREFVVEISLDQVVTHSMRAVKHNEAIVWNEEVSMCV
jgi:hypothetical protein